MNNDPRPVIGLLVLTFLGWLATEGHAEAVGWILGLTAAAGLSQSGRSWWPLGVVFLALIVRIGWVLLEKFSSN